MSGLEAFGVALGCTSLLFGLVPPICDYRALPGHCAELQDFIKRQQQSLDTIQVEFGIFLAHEILYPGSSQLPLSEIESIQNFIVRYRKCLHDFSAMLEGISSPITKGGKPKSSFDGVKERLRMIISGRTGMGLGTLQQKQSFLQMYMMEAKGYRRRLAEEKKRRSPLPPTRTIPMGQTASAAYKVHPNAPQYHPNPRYEYTMASSPALLQNAGYDIPRSHTVSPARTLVGDDDFNNYIPMSPRLKEVGFELVSEVVVQN